MGDRRFAAPYRAIRDAPDPLAATARLSDDEVVQALAHASRERDPYAANVLASEAMNRMRRARLVNEHIGEGVCVLTAEGVIQSMNPAARRLLAWRAEDVARGIPHERLHVNGPCCVCRSMAAMEPCESDEEAFATRLGLATPVSCVVAPVLVEGLCEGFVLAFRDMRERRAAEADHAGWTALMEAFYHLHDTLGIGLVITEGPRLHYANDAFRAMVGRSLEELRGTRDLLTLVPPGERDRLERAMGVPMPQRPVRATLLAREGARVPVDLYVAIAKGSTPQGEPRFVCLVQRRDVTPRA